LQTVSGAVPLEALDWPFSREKSRLAGKAGHKLSGSDIASKGAPQWAAGCAAPKQLACRAAQLAFATGYSHGRQLGALKE